MLQDVLRAIRERRVAETLKIFKNALGLKNVGCLSCASCAKEVYEEYKWVSGLKQKATVLLCLNRHNKIIKEVCLLKEIPPQTATFHRELIKEAIRMNATKVVFIHNHIGGSSAPSMENKLNIFGTIITVDYFNLEFVDYIIISNDGYYSFREDQLEKGETEISDLR